MKRYNISTTVHGDACLQQWYNGKIVLYEDHEKSIAALRAKLKQAEEERDDRRMSLAQEIAGALKARGLYCPKDFNSPDIIQAVGLALESLSEHRMNFDLAREAEKRHALELAARDAELDLYRKAVEPVRAWHTRYNGDEDMDAEHEAYQAIEDCIRILGEAGNAVG